MKVVKWLNIEIPSANTTEIFEAIKKTIDNLKKDEFDIVFSETTPIYEHIRGSTKKGIGSFKIIIGQKFKKKRMVLKDKYFFERREEEEITVDKVRAPFFYFLVNGSDTENKKLLGVRLIKGFNIGNELIFYRDDGPAKTELYPEEVKDLLIYRLSYYVEEELEEIIPVFNKLSEGIIGNLR